MLIKLSRYGELYLLIKGHNPNFDTTKAKSPYLKPYQIVFISGSFGFKLPERGGSTLYEIYIGFCPRIDFHNIMLIDCLTLDYSICDIVFLLPIYMVKKQDVM